MRYCNTASPIGQYSCGLPKGHSDVHWAEYNRGGAFRWPNSWALDLTEAAK